MADAVRAARKAGLCYPTRGIPTHHREFNPALAKQPATGLAHESRHQKERRRKAARAEHRSDVLDAVAKPIVERDHHWPTRQRPTIRPRVEQGV
jgi:hypothetical protein